MMNRWMGVALACGWLAAGTVYGQGYGEPAPVGGAGCETIPGPLTTPYAPQGPPDCMSLPANLPNATTPPGCCGAADCCPVAYISGEYLLWWFKKDRLSAPLLTTAAPGTTSTGVLTDPNTVILLDSSGLGNNPQSGGRLTAGFWFDSSHIFALEGDGFIFERRPERFIAQSNAANGNPLIAVPFTDVTAGFPGAPASYVVTNTGVSTGVASVETSNKFWGAEANLILNTPGCCCGNCGVGASIFAGFRYLDFSERTEVDTNSMTIATGASVLTDDTFRTRNQFYGGQLGVRLGFNAGALFFAGQAKCAIGQVDQSIDTLGTVTNIAAPGAVPASSPGGLLAVGSNSGRFNQTKFAYVPEAEGRIGWQFTPCFSMWAGYSLLYWNEVLRSGQQIDPNVVMAQQLGGVPQPGTFPQVLFHQTSLWAQGINVGLEIIY
jgi:hypothetical protein